MPEQEGQCEGENHRTVIARERVIRRMVQEGIADVIDKRTIVRERMAQNVTRQDAYAESHRHFDYKLALRFHLATRSPQPEDGCQRGHDTDQIFCQKGGEVDHPLGRGRGGVDQIKQLIIQIL